MDSSNNYEGEKMVKAELIENPQENELIINDNVPDVDVAIEQWGRLSETLQRIIE